jgi:tetratricopeptide (TPR) repeat protein
VGIGGRWQPSRGFSRRPALWLVLILVAAAEVVGVVYYLGSTTSSASLSPHRIALGKLSDALLHDPPDKVRAAYESYLAGYPGNTKTRMEFAGFLEKQSQPSAALAQYQAVSQQEPRSIEALKGLARCHSALGHHDLAALHLEDATRIRPDDAPLLKEFGLACHRAGDPGRAMEALHRSLAIDPNQQDLFPLVAQIAQGKSAGDDSPSLGTTRRMMGPAASPALSPDFGPRVPAPPVPRPVDPARYGLGRNPGGP